MADDLKYEKNLEMNAGNSLTAATVTYVMSFGTTAGALVVNAAGDGKTAVYLGVAAGLSFIASALCGRRHDRDVNELKRARNNKRLETKF